MRAVLFLTLFSLTLVATEFSNIVDKFNKIELELSDSNLSQEEKINESIEAQNSLLNSILLQIKSNEVNISKSVDSYSERVNFLSQRVSINLDRGNDIAVARDNLEIFTINMEINFSNFIKELRKAREIYVSELELEKIIDKFLNLINSEDTSAYQKMYTKYNQTSSSSVVDAFRENYEKYVETQKVYIKIAEYLKDNISKFAKENILIKILNLDYFANYIDETQFAKSLNPYFEHYLSVKVGRVIIAILIITFILSIRNYFIPLTVSILERVAQRKGESKLNFHRYLVDSISNPLKVTLVILSVEIGLRVISIENPKLDEFIDKFQTLYIISIAWVIYNLLNNAIIFFSESITTKYPNVRKEMVNFFVTIFKAILFILILLLILRDLGYDVTTILASLGVGGIAIALAAQNTLSNFFGSLTIILDNSFSQGDWIEADGVNGTVVELGLRSTTIRTFDNALVTVPNASLANTAIKNWSRRRIGRQITMKIGVTYESKKEDILRAVDEIREYLIQNPKIADSSSKIERKVGSKLVKKEDLLGVKNSILVYFDEYGDFSVNIFIYCFSKSTDWDEFLRVKQEVLSKIWDIIEQNSLEFAYPTQKLFLANESKV